MGFVCGLVGLPGCGKTTIFNAMTAAGAAGFGAQEANRAIIQVPDDRIQPLVELFSAPKQVPTTVEVVDIPGLKSGSTAADGRGGKLLGHIKDVDALMHVVRCFDDPNLPHEYDTIDPARDVETIDLEMMVADARTITNKIERMTKKAKTGDADAKRAVADCEKIRNGLEEGIPARKQELNEQEARSIMDCNLLSIKPVMYVANIKSPEDRTNAHVRSLAGVAEAEQAQMEIICGRDEAEIAELPADEQQEFLRELGLEESSMRRLIRAGYKTLGLVNFITAGPKEVHIWTCAAGSKAPQAAGKIHSDMEHGFIRMEVMRCEDLLELGSEDAVRKAGKLRTEGKDYVVRDGDIVFVKFSR